MAPIHPLSSLDAHLSGVQRIAKRGFCWMRCDGQFQVESGTMVVGKVGVKRLLIFDPNSHLNRSPPAAFATYPRMFKHIPYAEK